MDDASTLAQAAAETAADTEGLEQLLALKDADTFLVADAWGDVRGGVDGLFDRDTRILSRLVMSVGAARPSKLSSGVSEDNVYFTFHGANRPLPPMGKRATPAGVLHIERRRLLWRRRLYERVRLSNHGLDEVMLPLVFDFAADFRDIFEVRGQPRPRRGTTEPPQVDGRSVVFGYHGLDGARRGACIAFSEPPARLTGGRAEFLFALAAGARMDLYIEVGPDRCQAPDRARFRSAAAEARMAMRRRRRGARLRGPRSPRFNSWLDQSRSDVALLTTDLETGPYPYAGIPWFSTPFGRDGILTAWEMLWLDPDLARGVLAYLAGRQATTHSAFQDAAPGKIMHETRRGEMAALKEVAFGLYYGGVDTTPLFIALAGAYARRTGDLAFIQEIWPVLTAAAEWMTTWGDSDGDGLIDYARGAETGLTNQGWKDSEDSIFHADGRFPDGPIALLEVQGYAYAAYRALSDLAWRLGSPESPQWARRAEDLAEQVEARFWMEEEGFYAIAVDGQGRLCRSLASNAGHLLFSGLPRPDRAQQVIRRLMSAEFRNGWGLRTLAVGQARYNPMSYHNGSVWPHDTALCAAGMARFGERDAVALLTSEVYGAAAHFDMRLPELFCGFAREPGEPPIAYPVACLPQAWAAGSVFLLMQSCLGLTIDAFAHRIEIDRPTLPPGIDRLVISDLRIGESVVDLSFDRVNGLTTALPVRREGPRVDLVTLR